jgi:hypothetical protein
MYQPVIVNIHYPKSNAWSQDVIEDLHSNSDDEDKHGTLQVTHTWRGAVQEAIMVLTKGNDLGLWNWDDNHYLGWGY